jgi:hypothetical protein
VYHFSSPCKPTRRFVDGYASTDGNFTSLTPNDSDPRKWLDKQWIDQHSKKRFWITTHGHCGSRQTARVKTYGDFVAEYEFHPEAKCADALGNPCERQTIGLLQRRHIKIDLIKGIGKESNSLENADEGMFTPSRMFIPTTLIPNGANGFLRFSLR